MNRAALLLIVAVGAMLRFSALDGGLPNPNARPDEREILQHTAGFLQGDFNTRWFVYPNTYMYLVWVWEEAVLAGRRLWIDSPPYRVMLTQDLPTLLLIGRGLSAVAGTATILLIHRVGRAVAGTAGGLVAATLLATNWLHVRDSHALKTESLLAGGILFAVWLIGRWMAAPSRASAIAAGAGIGLATSCKYPAIFLLLAAWVATGRSTPGTGFRRWLPTRPFWVMLGSALATVVVLNPYLVLDGRRTLDWALMLSVMLYATRTEDRIADGAAWLDLLGNFLATRAFGYHAFVSLGLGAGLLVALATPVAILVALRRPREPIPFVAATFCVVFYLIAGASPVHLARYFTPLVPLVALLVGRLIVRTLGPRPLAVTLVTLALAAEPLARAIAANRVASRPDTRALATAWMAEHLPRGTSLLVLGNHLLGVGTPILPAGVTLAPPVGDPPDLRRQGVTHVLTHDHPLPFSELDPVLMATLAPQLELAAGFSPWRNGPAGTFEREDAYYVPFAHFSGVVRPGPDIHLYTVRP